MKKSWLERLRKKFPEVFWFDVIWPEEGSLKKVVIFLNRDPGPDDKEIEKYFRKRLCPVGYRPEVKFQRNVK